MNNSLSDKPNRPTRLAHVGAGSRIELEERDEELESAKKDLRAAREEFEALRDQVPLCCIPFPLPFEEGTT